MGPINSFFILLLLLFISLTITAKLEVQNLTTLILMKFLIPLFKKKKNQ